MSLSFSTGTCVSSLLQGTTNVTKNATAQKPIDTAKAPFRPCICATRIPGSSLGENTSRSSDAPVAMSFAASTAGADDFSFTNIWLTNVAWAEDTVKAPPTVWKTILAIRTVGYIRPNNITYSRHLPSQPPDLRGQHWPVQCWDHSAQQTQSQNQWESDIRPIFQSMCQFPARTISCCQS